MNTLPLYQVDAFTERRFAGNPAAVCPLDAWLSDETLQAIAGEMNLSETAFVVPEGEGFRLRWFTPTVEVDLCGHATLAAAFVLFTERGFPGPLVRFVTRSGALGVTREGEDLVLDFPARPGEAAEVPPALGDALGRAPRAFRRARDWLAVFESSEQVRALAPDMARVAALPGAFAVIATAPGTGADADVDFVSRFFAPSQGIPEDPVTGSAHCTLVPYWSGALGKKRLRARQVSRRTGELRCEDRGERIGIGGRAVLVGRGSLFV